MEDSEWKQVWAAPAEETMADCQSVGSMGKLLLTLANPGGVVNSALHNVEAGHRTVIFDQFHAVQDIVGSGGGGLTLSSFGYRKHHPGLQHVSHHW